MVTQDISTYRIALFIFLISHVAIVTCSTSGTIVLQVMMTVGTEVSYRLYIWFF